MLFLNTFNSSKSNFFIFGPSRLFSTKKPPVTKIVGKKISRSFKRIAGLFTASSAHKRRQRMYNKVTRRDLKLFAKKGTKCYKNSGHLVAKIAYFASTFWRLRFFAFRRSTTAVSVRVATYKSYRTTPHLFYPVPHYVHATRPKYNPGPKIVRNQLWRLFRMRMERFMFKALGCRVYVWFQNLWRTLSSDIVSWVKYDRALMSRLAKKGTRFTIREAQARVLMQSAWMAVTMMGGVAVFMQMLSKMVQTFRSHWPVVLYTLRILDQCRCFFWYKTLLQYRMTVRGKFGGHMRANQKTFQHGVVRLNAYSVDLDYYRIRPVTRYGTFSLRFWLQFRDLRIARINKVTQHMNPKFYPQIEGTIGTGKLIVDTKVSKKQK